jgi:uncharacterized protein
MIIADTSGLYAIYNRRQPEHQAARSAVERDGGPLVLSPLASEVAVTYGDMQLGLTDASIVVQAARHKTTKILSLDYSHFGAVKPLTSDPSFTLLPRDDQA